MIQLFFFLFKTILDLESILDLEIDFWVNKKDGTIFSAHSLGSTEISSRK